FHDPLTAKSALPESASQAAASLLRRHPRPSSSEPPPLLGEMVPAESADQTVSLDGYDGLVTGVIGALPEAGGEAVLDAEFGLQDPAQTPRLARAVLPHADQAHRLTSGRLRRTAPREAPARCGCGLRRRTRRRSGSPQRCRPGCRACPRLRLRCCRRRRALSHGASPAPRSGPRARRG